MTISVEAQRRIAEQLEKFPPHSVVLDGREHAWQKDSRGSWWDGLTGRVVANSYLAQQAPLKTLYVGQGKGR
jgi:hypothetical protein